MMVIYYHYNSDNLVYLTLFLQTSKKNKGPGKSVPLDNPFNSPDLIPKLASNPTTAAYLQDTSFQLILKELRTDSKSLGK